MLFADEISRRIDVVRESGDDAQLGLWLQMQGHFLHLAHNGGLVDFNLTDSDPNSSANVLVPPPILTIENSPISLDTGLGRLIYSSPTATRESDLTPLEVRMLAIFMHYPNQVLTDGQIISSVWNNEPDPLSRMNHLRVGVFGLRQKVEPDPKKPIHIQTVRTIGYQFMP